MNILIVARYNEDITWLDKINFDHIVYNKGEINSNYINLPNIGREADTYINYIISNYDNLPEIIVFCQGNPFDHCYDFIERVNNTTDYNNIVWLCTNWGPVTKNYLGGPGSIELPLLDLCHKLFDTRYDESKTFTFSPGAQYMVPNQYILNKSISWWKYCYSIFLEYIETSPWSFERLWPMIWNYSKNH